MILCLAVVTPLKLVRCPLARSYPRHFTFYVADPVSSIPANGSLSPRSLGANLTREWFFFPITVQNKA